MAAELRRRKVKDHIVGPKSKRSSKSHDVSGIQRSLICLIISATVLFSFLAFYVDTYKAADHIAKSLGYHDPVYAVVIDAGSTGSRVLAFSFHKAYINGQLILDKELFEEVKPGLSSYAKDPKKGAESIAELLELAKKEIPEEYWSKTPLVLKATAGLRLLPGDQAQKLLDAVSELFRKCPFKTNNDSVSIMDGVDEGIYSWFTVNFLLDKLSGNPDRTAAALDLGGGSTQVTFAPTTPQTLQHKKYIHTVGVVRGSIPVYTQSYLGLGLMAARKAIMSHNHSENATNLISACVNPFISGTKWSYGGVEYTISGAPNKNQVNSNDPKVDFEECVRIISDYIFTKTIPLPELDTKLVNAFSYYYDRAVEVGLIDPFKGGKILVGDFYDQSKAVCEIVNTDQPFICLDLTYIWVLLEKGFGIKKHTTLYLHKKINGHEVSWALGCAFNELKKEMV